VEMEEVGVTEVGEAIVEVGAVGEDEAAHEAIEALSSLRGCLTISTTTVCTTREIGNASRHDTTETGDGLNGSSLTLERLSVTKDVHSGKARHLTLRARMQALEGEELGLRLVIQSTLYGTGLQD
jgi:hypothetical protein